MMPRVGLNRTVRAGSLLTLFLFIMSASISATLDRFEASPSQSQLAVFSGHGREVALFHGDLAQLGAAEAALPRPADVHHARPTIVLRDYRWL
jgi:hypothetical protein